MNTDRDARGVFVKGHSTSGMIRDKIAATLSKTGDLTGKRFGQWIVLERHEPRDSQRMWLCRCDCGTEKEVAQRHLTKGKSTCCKECMGKKCTIRASRRRVLPNGRILYSKACGKRILFWNDIRKKQFEKQSGICPVCLKPMIFEEANFDHDHETDLCRELVHRGCNVFIGFMENHPEYGDRVKLYLEKYRQEGR